LSLLLIVMVLVSVRRSHIRPEYSVSWLGAALTLLVLSRLHAILEKLAALLGLPSAPVALLMLVGCLFLLVLFRLSVIISALKDSNIALTQRLAIVEYLVQNKHAETEDKA
ncbi:MAG TPA: DUF2304 domain-containing protein, partial [Bryobacteraceae bacterium]|nr:DUF2304 domain-containing protein [Bryobacteraceae bacterium]